MRNKEMMHGLFGKLKPGNIKEFSTWQEPAKIIKTISEENKNIFRSIISFKRDTANELGLTTQKDWQRYIETHISTIARMNDIKIQNLGFVCAVHNERNHPHVHIMFWDNEQQVLKNYVSREIPNKIRRQLIKDTFEARIKEYCEEKDKGRTDIREITDEMVKEFENYIKELYPEEYKEYKKLFETFDEEEFILDQKNFKFSQERINHFADKLFMLKEKMPKSGRLAYQLLPEDTKAQVDALVIEMLKDNYALRRSVKLYIDSKMSMAMLYTSDKKYLKAQKKKFQKEAEKLIANRVLGTIRILLRKEMEIKKVDFLKNQKRYYTEQLFAGLIDMFQMKGNSIDKRVDDLKDKVMSTELSKLAKKEYYLKNKDKGMDL